jgi:hypothetical protein
MELRHCLMADVINLRLVRKAKNRIEREARAAENRRKHGRPRDERQKSEAEMRLADRRLEGHRLDEAPDQARDQNEESR